MQSKMYTVLHVKYMLFLSDFNETRSFLIDLKNAQISNFMKICPVGGEPLYVDRRTEMTKQTVAFRNFANVPKYVH